MIDKEFRERLERMFKDEPHKPQLFEDHAYDKSIMGMTNTGQFLYDYARMVKEFMEDENCSEDTAIEWIEYNTIPALDYNSDPYKPIVMYRMEYLEDLYD